MTINVDYYGMLKDHSGRRSETMEISQCSVREFKKSIVEKYPGMSNIPFQIAVDSRLTNSDQLEIRDGERISLLPPFAGG